MVNVTARVETDLDAMSVSSEGTDSRQTEAMVDSTVEAYGFVIASRCQAPQTGSPQAPGVCTDLEVEINAIEAQLEENPDNAVLGAQLTAATQQLIDINGRIADLRTEALLYGSGVQLYLSPNAPGSQIAPRPLRNAAIAFILGALAAGAFAWWKAEQDQRADTKDVAAGVLDAPLLASVPDYSEVHAWAPAPTLTHPDSSASEAYHFALSSLSFVMEENGGRSVVVTSAGPDEGKTVTALNLAIAAMKDGRRPLLIDGDERARGLTKARRHQRAAGIEQRSDWRRLQLADHAGRVDRFHSCQSRPRFGRVWLLPIRRVPPRPPGGHAGPRHRDHRCPAGHGCSRDRRTRR